MSLITIILVVVALSLPLGPAPAKAFAQDIEGVPVTLMRDDEYVVTIMRVIDKHGKKIKGLINIKSFETNMKSFAFENIYGETKIIPVSEIERIEFEQNIQTLNPVAQESAWEIITSGGKENKIRIPARELEVRTGLLILRSSLATSLLEGERDLEVLNISFNPSEDRFDIIVRNIRYEKKYYGTGGASGIRKGLQ
ncbi:MAG: hypothetical protein QME44_08665 [Thermodesulfobacteriota bacterium]|nr:hypothetical protein [Thermodesulfobacteriota bacterium]